MWQKVKAATIAQKPEMMAREEDKRPYGSSWLNGERWEDVVKPEAARPSIYRDTRELERQERINQRWEGLVDGNR